MATPLTWRLGHGRPLAVAGLSAQGAVSGRSACLARDAAGMKPLQSSTVTCLQPSLAFGRQRALDEVRAEVALVEPLDKAKLGA